MVKRMDMSVIEYRDCYLKRKRLETRCDFDLTEKILRLDYNGGVNCRKSTSIISKSKMVSK